MSQLFRQSSGLRTRPVEETLGYARRLGREVGIARVTDTTRLDRIGVPVFASIRPQAHPASLHVSAGKGQTPAEAEVGAWMEGIELAFAEPERARPPVVRARAGDVIGEFCLRDDAVGVDPRVPLGAIEAVDLGSGEAALVPAELVLFPAPLALIGASLFTADGNGLASGNSVDEATVHGLAEVIERDVMAFHFARDTSQGVPVSTLPRPLADLAERLDRTGFDLVIRHERNAFGLPWFKAVLSERNAVNAIHPGFGCSPIREIALSRAITEAIQARLTVIHGGRDDLRPVLRHAAGARADLAQGEIDRAHAGTDAVGYEETPDWSHVAVDVSSAKELLLERLRVAGFPRALRVVYTPPELPLHVVRVLVPGLAIKAGPLDRGGPRLRAHARGKGA